jgi:hypothetical protein
MTNRKLYMEKVIRYFSFSRRFPNESAMKKAADGETAVIECFLKELESTTIFKKVFWWLGGY